jgi:hypothetical protein
MNEVYKFRLLLVWALLLACLCGAGNSFALKHSHSPVKRPSYRSRISATMISWGRKQAEVNMPAKQGGLLSYIWPKPQLVRTKVVPATTKGFLSRLSGSVEPKDQLAAIENGGNGRFLIYSFVGVAAVALVMSTGQLLQSLEFRKLKARQTAEIAKSKLYKEV